MYPLRHDRRGNLSKLLRLAVYLIKMEKSSNFIGLLNFAHIIFLRVVGQRRYSRSGRLDTKGLLRWAEKALRFLSI